MRFPRALLIGIFVVALGVPPVERLSAAAENRPPNIVFLLADDLGYRDVGAFGQEKFRTPNLDQLAREGMKLTAVYSGNTVCAPSRCVLLSGLHPGHAYVRENRQVPGYALGEKEGQTPVPPNELTFPITLKKLGYATGGFGKWGLGPVASTGNPNQQGMDKFFGYICQAVAHNYYPAYLWDNGKQVMLDNPPPPDQPRLARGADARSPDSYKKFEQGRDYAPDRITAEALKFVREHKDGPFFLYYATTVPHLAYQVPEDSRKEYDGKFPEEPYPGGGHYVPARTPRATYAAMITRMDREIGRIVSLVKELGLENDTIFVFTSDNGAPGGLVTSYFNSGGNFRGRKGSVYEGGFRVPGIVRWSGHVKPGGASDRVVGFEDWMPTLLELIGHKDAGSPAKVAKVDGISFAPTLLGQAQPPRPFLYREFPTRGGAQFIRVDNWRLVRHLGNNDRPDPVQPGEENAEEQVINRKVPGASDPNPRGGAEFELFDLSADPSEQKNVADAHPEVVAKLKRILVEQHTPSKLFPLRGIDPPRGARRGE